MKKIVLISSMLLALSGSVMVQAAGLDDFTAEGVKLRGDGSVDDSQPGVISTSTAREFGQRVSREARERNEVRRAERVERGEKAEKVEKVEKVERAEKVEKAERPEKVEKAERPEKVERPERGERGEGRG